MAAVSALKPVPMYSVAGRLRHKNAIYENELLELLKRRKVLQLVIFCGEDTYSLAVLTQHRMEEISRPWHRESSKVVRLRPVNISQEGFAPLHSVRNRTVRQFRSLDTLVRSLKSCGPMPPVFLRQGAPK